MPKRRLLENNKIEKGAHPIVSRLPFFDLLRSGFPKWLKGSFYGPTRSWVRDKFRRLRIEPLERRRLLTSLSGFVFNDANDDGSMDAGDAGLRNVPVTVTGTDDVLGSITMNTVTSSTGAYSFNLGSGTYKITVNDPGGYVGSFAQVGSQATGINGFDAHDLYIDQIGLGAGVSGTSNNFGEIAAAAVSGTVWNDLNDDGVKQASEPASFGATVQLSGTDDRANDVETSATTSTQGSYSFAGLRPGTYTLTVDQPSGFLAGKVVGGSEADVSTTQPTLQGGQGQVLFTLNPGDNGAGNNFAELATASLSGYVWNETSNNNGVKTASEPVIAGAKVILTGNSDLGAISPTTALTNASGLYSFAGLRPGTYALTEVQPAGYSAGKEGIGTPGGTVGNGQFTNIVLAAGVAGANNNFGEIDQPPTVATPASASPSPVTGTTCNLSVLGASAGGQANLTYTWAAIGTPPAPVNFGINGTNAAQNTTATFSKAGSYVFQVTITDLAGATVTSIVNVTVNQKLAAIAVSPASVSLSAGTTQQFMATAEDQFGAVLASQPGFTWTTSAGTIGVNGLLTAPAAVVSNGTVTASSGGINGTAAFTVSVSPPTIKTPASALPNPATQTTCNLSVLGADNAGESTLTYTWATTGTPPAAVNFSINGTNAAKNTVATFSKAGNYSFQVTVTGPGGLTVTSSVNETVVQTLTAIVVAPTSVNLRTGGTQQFTATADDQFGAPLATQPTIIWTTTAGTISTSGLLTAPSTPVSSGTVTASSNGLSATAAFTVKAPPTVAVAASASPNPVPGTTTNLSVLGADASGESTLSYTWAATGTPPAAVTYSLNGTNAAKNSTATFSKAGNYSFQVTITDAGGLTVTSSVNVTVNQTLTAIAVSPASVNLNDGAQQQYTATAKDQFGTALATQPSFTWSASAGTISTSGLLTAPNTMVNSGTVKASSGSVNGSATFTVAVQPPTVALAASASPNPVTGTTTNLSVLGADAAGESNLTYTWVATGTPPAAVTFSLNGSNAAKNSTATFSKAGNYSFQVTITNPGGLTATSSVNVIVNQTPTTIAVLPASINLHDAAQQQYTATADDQFGAALATQPSFTWTTSAGTISASGLLTTPNTSVSSGTVTAGSGGITGSATFTVTVQPPTVAVAASASPNPVTGTTTNLSALGADSAGESNLTYNWAATGVPPAAVSFSSNGSNAAKNTTATFSKAGNYTFQVTIMDPGGLTATSSVNVTVNQTLTAITVAPASINLHDAAQQQFTATAQDQFGAAFATQPSFTWATSAGTISTSGLLTTPDTAVSNGSVTASSGGVTGSAAFTVTVQPPTVAVAASASPNPVTGTTTNLSALGADSAGESNLTYTWAATGTPPAAVIFSLNGSNTAKNSTATFSKAGNYSFQVTIMDPGGLTATSSVNVTVNQTLTTIAVVPASINLLDAAQQQFTATAEDQFGAALATQPSFTWATSAGTISTSGLLTTPDTAVNNGTVTASSGGVNGSATFTVTVQPPTVAVAASASPNPVTGTTTNLSALGADTAGESNLTYTWIATGTPPAAVSFSLNGSNAAKDTTATFTKAGNYSFQVTIMDPGGLTATSSVNVTVHQTLTAIAVAPASVNLNDAAQQQFAATAEDQFGAALATQPSFTWATSAGTISTSGLLTTPDTSVGNGSVTASSGGVTGSAAFTVTVQPPTVAVAASASPNPVTGTTTNLSALGADSAGESNLTYTWAATGTPPAAVTFSLNGNNAAKNSTATFTKAGNYSFQVTITDPGGLTATSSVNVTVNQTLTAIAVAPASVNLNDGAQQQFTATAEDQFGTALATQPTFTWATSAGTITAGGLLTAPDSAVTSGTVTAEAPSGSGGVTGSAAFTVTVQPPTVAVAASASPNPVTGTTTNLSALGADSEGESNLTYTWAVTGTSPAAVSFSANGTNAAKNSTATFSEAGNYTFQVTITNAAGLTATSSVNVTVDQTLTAIGVAPASINLHTGDSQQYTATAQDQFGAALATQPSFTWTTTAGTISTSGLLTAPSTSVTSATVTATSGGLSGSAMFTVNNLAPTVAVAASASPNPAPGTTTNLTVLGADNGGESNLTYTWATTGTPPAPVSFSLNGSNAAKDTTATFSKAGNYSFQVTIMNAGGLTVTSSVDVAVNQTLTAITVTPASINLNDGAQQQYTATADDQFGAALAVIPSFTWTASAGTITAGGLLTAPNTSVNNGTVTASSGGVNGSAAFTVTVLPPTVAVAASASPNPVTGMTTNLSALGADSAGESTLTYTWATTGAPPATVNFSLNGTNAAKDTTATFTKAGIYSFQVTITDPGGLTATSSVNVTVNQTLTAIAVTPASINLNDGAQQQFTATADDQFGAALAVQPSFIWATSAGTITAGGLLTAPITAVNNGTVTASSGGINGSTTFTVTVQPPTVAVAASASPNPVTGMTTNLSALGADSAGESTLTYTWAATGTPPAPVSFSLNGANAAKDTTATFTKAGNYTFQVTITNPSGLTATSSVNVTVNQTLTSIAVAPASNSLHAGEMQQFTATAEDQFGAALAAQPSFTWATTAGTISTSGLLTAPNTAVNSGSVTAVSGGVSGAAAFTVNSASVQPPTVATPASATPNPVMGATTNLSVLGADPAGESTLTYTWATIGTPPAAVSFSANGTNAAKNATATFGKAGSYTFQVTIKDKSGLTATSNVNVIVDQTLTAIAVAPTSDNLYTGGMQQYTATAEDQFGAALATQPSFTWTTTAGTISTNGLLTAPSTPLSSGIVTASSGGFSGTAEFTVSTAPPATSSLSGYVYVDTTNSGQRMISPGVYKLGISDVAVTLERTDATAPAQTVLTQIDGSYQFGSLPAGTYTLIETQPQQYLTGGKDTAGSLGGQGSTSDMISQIVVPAGQSGTEYNFGEWLLAPGILSKRLALASTPTTQDLVSQQVLDPAPVLHLGSAAPNYTTSTTAGSPVYIAPSATVSYMGVNLASLTVTIANLKNGGSESLLIPGQTIGTVSQPLALGAPLSSKISTAYNAATGALTLTGIDSVGNYQSVLRSIQYENTAASPDTSPRTISVVAYTAISASNTATSTITDPPAASAASKVFAPAISKSSAARTGTAAIIGPPAPTATKTPAPTVASSVPTPTVSKSSAAAAASSVPAPAISKSPVTPAAAATVASAPAPTLASSVPTPTVSKSSAAPTASSVPAPAISKSPAATSTATTARVTVANPPAPTSAGKAPAPAISKSPAAPVPTPAISHSARASLVDQVLASMYP